MNEDHEELFDDLFDMDDTAAEETSRSETQRAPYGYVGGKSRSLHRILPHLPYRFKWVDHFGGSGVVTLNRQESKLEVFNDRWSGVTCFYKCIQKADKCKRLIERLNATCHSREEFYDCRLQWINEQDEVERAAQWYYMMRSSVIGKGVCFARATNSLAPIVLHSSLQLFMPIHYRFKNILVENLDFETCFKDFDSHDCVHYCDPPYLNTDPGLYCGGWSVDDLERLIRCIRNSHGFVALSHYSHELLDSQTFWTKRITWEVPITAEVQAFTKENNKQDFAHVQNVDYATEVLYIKE